MRIALWAIFAFLVLKFAFGLFGWYSRDKSDARYRKTLDAFWDQLQEGSFFEFFQRQQQRLVTRVKETFWHPPRRLWFFCCFEVAIIGIALVAAAELFETVVATRPEHIYGLELELRPNRNYFFGKGFLSLFFPGWAPMGQLEPIVTNLVLIPVGVAFALLSLFISWALLRRASQSRTAISMLVHMAINAAIVVVSVLFVNAVHAGTFWMVASRLSQ